MEKELVFHILQIPETKDEEQIASAYYKLLKTTNPEDNPEGFKKLRQAYEEAIAFARHSDAGEDVETEKNDVDLWIDRIDKVYEDLNSRYKAEEWEEVLNDPISEGLDTSIEAREKFIVYLMSHYYLPNRIWKLIDGLFNITGDIPSLSQQFPVDFLNYVRFHVENETFIPYEMFRYIKDEKNSNPDGYIGKYLDIKGKVDNHEVQGCLEEIEELKAFGIYHPFEDVERMKALVLEERYPEALNLSEKLMSDYGDNTYVQLYVGEAKWYNGQKEEAYKIWNNILSEVPDHYMAKYNVIKYQMENADYYSAKENMIDLLEMSGRNEELESWMAKANEYLIEEYKEELAKGIENPNFPGEELEYELGWCLFQNEKYDEAVEFLGKFKDEQKKSYDYCNLYGRLLYEIRKYEEALPYLERWLELIKQLKDDGTDKTRKRMSRKGRAGYILGGCYYELGRQKEAEDTLIVAIKDIEDDKEKMGCRQYLAYIYLKSRQFEKAVDVCDGIIKDDEGYYPAYLIRQEACYELKKGQEVVNDYHNAINIVPNYFQPYMYAAEVFFFYGQYEDAKEVYELARKNEVQFSERMKLYEAKVIRNMSENTDDRNKARDILHELKKNLNNEECDIEDKSEVEYELGLLDWDDNEMKSALTHLRKAVSQNPDRMQYRMIRGNVYLDMKKYKDALQEYDAAEKEYGDDPWIWYNRGMCWEGMGKMDTAVKCYEKSLECQDGYRDACEKISEYYEDKYHKEYKKENLELAIKYLDRQIAVTESCYNYVCRGLVYLHVMDFEPAIRDFEKALEFDSNDWAALNNIGCCYKYMGQFEKAIEYFEKSVRAMGENHEVLPYSNMADCYEALRDYEMAIDCYKKDLEMFPERLGFWEEIGDLYTYMEKYDEAEEAYKKAGNSTLKNIGDMWLKRGNKKKCLQYYKKALALATSADDISERLCDIGELYMGDLMEYKKAISYFKRALKKTTDPYNKYDCERYMARSYYMMGDYKNAKIHAQASLEYFEKSGNGEIEDYVNYAPYSPARLASFGWIYLCIGMKDKAIEYYNKMDKITRCRSCRHKECFESRLYMGRFYESRGDYSKALEELNKALERNPHCGETMYAIENIQKVKGKK